jgi:hypothetical protein
MKLRTDLMKWSRQPNGLGMTLLQAYPLERRTGDDASDPVERACRPARITARMLALGMAMQQVAGPTPREITT